MLPFPMPAGLSYDPTFMPYIVGQKYGVGAAGNNLIVYFYPGLGSNYFDPQGNQVTAQVAIQAGLKGDGIE